MPLNMLMSLMILLVEKILLHVDLFLDTATRIGSIEIFSLSCL